MRAAVLGSPIAHSKSPQLHLAAYRALGLTDWTYERIECTAEQLPSLVRSFGPEWVGVSVTMPGKFAALQFADERTDRAELVGSANTLVRTAHGWRADNTDVDGVDRRARAASTAALVVLGSGGTARAAVVAAGRPASRSGDRGRARPPTRRTRCWRWPHRWVSQARWRAFTDPGLADDVAAADAVVSTIPADAAAGHARGVAARAGAAGRGLRPVADAAGRRRRRRRRRGDRRAADAAAPGVRSGRAVHRAARAQRGDESGAPAALTSDHGSVVRAAVLVWLVALSVYDVRQRRLPNWLTLPGAAAVLTAATLAGRGMPALAGAAALGLLYLLVHAVAPSAMGAGDVKLALGVGAVERLLRGGRVAAGRAGRPAADRGVGAGRAGPSRRTHGAARPLDVPGHRRSRRAGHVLIARFRRAHTR